VKPYESIVNLGLLREFLRSNDFDVVMHGHKHTETAYWDEFGSDAGTQPKLRRLLVIAGSMLGGLDSARNEVCRLLNVDTRTTAGDVVVHPIGAVDAGGRLDNLQTGRRFVLWDRTGVCSLRADAVKTISGEHLDQVYDRLLGFFSDRSEHDAVNNLICEIGNAPQEVDLPSSYPAVQGKDGIDRGVWLRDMVRWWQRKETLLDDPLGFTHGERIYRYAGREDQLSGAIAALRAKFNTSRAIINLVDPPRDQWDSRQKAPAFCSLQFTIVHRERDLALNCTSYFRKQEMRYWWPVNVAEVALMQRGAVETLSAKYPGLRPGSIVTVSAIAYASGSFPKVAVPIVDRLLDEDPDTLWQLAYGLVWPRFPARNEVMEKWDRLLQDLLPSAKPDPDGVPVAINGLSNLLAEIKRFVRFHQYGDLEQVCRLLTAILQANRSYAADTKTAEASDEPHNEWRAECDQVIEQLRDAIQKCWARPSLGPDLHP
jgi:thymidylate synthase